MTEPLIDQVKVSVQGNCGRVHTLQEWCACRSCDVLPGKVVRPEWLIKPIASS